LGLVLEGVNQEVNKSRTSLYPPRLLRSDPTTTLPTNQDVAPVLPSQLKAVRAVLISRPMYSFSLAKFGKYFLTRSETIVYDLHNYVICKT